MSEKPKRITRIKIRRANGAGVMIGNDVYIRREAGNTLIVEAPEDVRVLRVDAQNRVENARIK